MSRSVLVLVLFLYPFLFLLPFMANIAFRCNFVGPFGQFGGHSKSQSTVCYASNGRTCRGRTSAGVEPVPRFSRTAG